MTLAEARAALETGAYTGLGFALGPDEDGRHWQGIDLDGTDTRPELAALVDLLPGYVERSPSGTGWHAIGIGRDFATLGSNTSGIEAYAHGRYFTVTGKEADGRLEDIADFVTVTLSPLHSPRAKAKDTPIERPHVDTTDQMVRDLRSALASMRADDRDLWVRMGLALKPLGDQGRALWLEWSQTSEKFDPRDAARVWESFKPEGTGPAAVFAEAQRAGWVNPAKGKGKTTETRRPVEQEGERHTHQTTGERGEKGETQAGRGPAPKRRPRTIRHQPRSRSCPRFLNCRWRSCPMICAAGSRMPPSARASGRTSRL
ncbi:MAG: PriCT-2 domain-containing protein [Chromatiales bacterium]|nr:PriCT-2 domain-containing protein [Chromatiales bacterium]